MSKKMRFPSMLMNDLNKRIGNKAATAIFEVSGRRACLFALFKSFTRARTRIVYLTYIESCHI